MHVIIVFYEISPLVCHFIKVHVYTLFRVNYALYEYIIFFKIKFKKINHFLLITLSLVDVLKNKSQEENVRII